MTVASSPRFARTILLLTAICAGSGLLAARQPKVSSHSDAEQLGVSQAQAEMRDFANTALAAAAESKRSFPAYAKWNRAIAAAVADGMSPSRLSRVDDPLRRLEPEPERLSAASKAAESELAAFLPPTPPGKDLAKISAFKKRTRPTSLTINLLTRFAGQPALVRSAAGRAIATYKLPG